jgi:hypothetical protein
MIDVVPRRLPFIATASAGTTAPSQCPGAPVISEGMVDDSYGQPAAVVGGDALATTHRCVMTAAGRFLFAQTAVRGLGSRSSLSRAYVTSHERADNDRLASSELRDQWHPAHWHRHDSCCPRAEARGAGDLAETTLLHRVACRRSNVEPLALTVRFRNHIEAWGHTCEQPHVVRQ